MTYIHIVGYGLSVSRQRGGDPRYYAEPWVTSSIIEALLQNGYRAVDMRMERRIADGCRPDLTIEPPVGPIEIWESKAYTPTNKHHAQARRYLNAASALWPGREVRVFLAWPADPLAFPRASQTIRFEAVA